MMNEDRSKTEACMFCGASESSNTKLEALHHTSLTFNYRRTGYCCVDKEACAQRCRNNVLKAGIR